MKKAVLLPIGFHGLLLSLFLALNSPRASEPLSVNSRITEITIFSDRAEVTRTGSTRLRTGRNTAVFEELPGTIFPGSIQLHGSGNAQLSDLRLERMHLSTTSDPLLEKLERNRTLLTDSLKSIEDKSRQVESEREFVENIASRLTRPSGSDHEKQPVLDPEKWMKMVSFYREKIQELDREARAAVVVQRALKKDIDKVNREIAELSKNGTQVRHRVLANLTTSADGPVRLRLRYMVRGPQWQPLYDVRVDSDLQKLALGYKAQITQNTGEDWRDVTVKLSTAQPQAGGQPPELTPWYVSLRPPPQPVRIQESAVMGTMSKKRGPAMLDRSFPEPVPAEEAASAPLGLAVSTAESKATSVLFVPAGKTSVLSDNQPYIVTITTLDLPVELHYSAVPRLIPHAFLQAHATNTSEFPLLPGITNVFLDNAFVANSSLELVAPEEEFQTFLGIDNAIEIEHKLVKRYEKKQKILTKKKELIFDYLTTVKNTKSSPQDIDVRDQMPLSRNEHISVECIEPHYKEDTDSLTIDRFNAVTWHCSLKPGETVTLPFTFSVTWPAGESVDGL